VPKTTPQRKLKQLIQKTSPKTFLAINFGCRVNAAETNQICQILVDQGFSPVKKNPGLIIVNTCAITKKGEKESLQKIRSLRNLYPQSLIVTTGCATLDSFSGQKNFFVLKNKDKQKLLEPNRGEYQPKIKDKFSSSKKFILKIQSGCNHYCTYCIVPHRRKELWSLPIENAIKTTKQAIKNDYTHLIITGVNLELYESDLDQLVKTLLEKTTIPLISFGSVPLNCVNQKFLNLYKKYPQRLEKFLHVPLQSGSNEILKLMNRPYTRLKIEKTLTRCLKIPGLKLGVDIIVGFPGETEKEFQKTLNLLKKYPFQKIHTFRFSLRPGTAAEKLLKKYPLIPTLKSKERSKVILSLA
jgi:threonylcarbamoyladenosine tRNA methylthiotransferase MtaB